MEQTLNTQQVRLKAEAAALASALERRNTSKRPIVVAFGWAANSEKLLAYVQQEAAKRHASAAVFTCRQPSKKTVNVRSLRQRFSGVFFDDGQATIFDGLAGLRNTGFDGVYVVVTRDQLSEVPRLRRAAKLLKYRAFGVLPVLTEQFKESGHDLRTVKRVTEQKRAARGQAFITYAMTRTDAKAMYEAFNADVRCARVVLSDLTSARTNKLIESGTPFVIDASGAAEPTLRNVQRVLEARGYATHFYVKEMPLPKVLTEAYLQQQAVYGVLREDFARDLVVMTPDTPMYEMVEHVWSILQEAEGGKVKTPTEVDQLKQKQKQEDMLTKRRQSDEVLAAQERELEKSADEKLAKMNEPKK